MSDDLVKREAEQRGYANAMEAERKLHEDRIKELEADKAKLLKALKRAATVIFNHGNRHMTQGISTAEVDLIDATISKIERPDQ